MVVDHLLSEWICSVSTTYELPRCARSVLTFIADNVTVSLWNKFKLGINFIVRAVGFCRSSVEKALSLLRRLRVIAYDGQGDLGQRGKLLMYRLSGTPDCPLPEKIVNARWEVWEDAQSLPPEWEAQESVSAGQDRNYVWKEQDPPGDIDRKPQRLGEGDGSGVCHRGEGGEWGSARWVPHLGPAPEWVAPASPVKRAVSAVRGLLGRFGGIHPTGSLEGSQGRCEEVSGRSEGAVSYLNRSTPGGIHPMSLFADPVLGDLPREARLLYLGLRELADSADQVRSDPRYLKGQIFPYDDDLTPSDVDLLINALADAGKIHRVPDHVVISDPGSVLVPLIAAPPVEKPKRRSRKKTEDADPWFTAFWDVYPRQTGYGAASDAFAKAIANGADPTVIIQSAAAYAARCQAIRKETQFTPHPATWLNQKRWNDAEEAAPQVRSKVDDAFASGMELLARYEEEERRALESGEDREPPKGLGW